MQKLEIDVQTGTQTIKDMTEAEIAELEAASVLSPEQIIKKYTSAIDVQLHSKAVEKGYDNILSACSYTGYPNFFEEESKRFVKWRADVWIYAKDILYNVQNNISPLPTIEEFILNMPQYIE
jgi:hypothetical protein